MKDSCLIEKDLLYCKGISDEALMTMIGIQLNTYNIKETLLIYSSLEYLMFGWKNRSKAKRNIIIKGMNELISNGYIKVIDEMKDHAYVCDISNIYTYDSEKYYIQVKKDDYYSIINMNNNIYSCKMLRYFVDLIGTFNCSKELDQKYRFKIGNSSIHYLSSVSGLNPVTLGKYNAILEKNKLIYIARRKASVINNIDSGKVYKQLPNVYSRYEDKDLCNEYISSTGIIKKDNVYINVKNEMRSLSQQYTSFIRWYGESTCPDIEKVKKAYNAAKQWNECKKEEYENKKENGYDITEPKYKDFSVFDKYDLTS